MPPWTDNLEGDTSGWSVQDGEDSEGTWHWGTPSANNPLGPAHSPTNAWGINLDGPTHGGLVETFLISPAVDLQGGNVASLTFWHNYDFTSESILEGGELLLFTNTQTQPITLAGYGDLPRVRKQEEFDLSPYIGTCRPVGMALPDVRFRRQSSMQAGFWMISQSPSQIF